MADHDVHGKITSTWSDDDHASGAVTGTTTTSPGARSRCSRTGASAPPTSTDDGYPTETWT
jgi:hypothetical protein